MTFLEIAFLGCALVGLGCLVFAVFGGAEVLFRRPLARLADWIIDKDVQ